MKNIHIRKCDDWIGIYVDGKMFMQGHRFYFMDGVEFLTFLFDIPAEITYEYDEDAEFPNELTG